MAGTATISTIKHDVTGAATRFNDGSGNEIGQLCKAWCNYDGSTPATRGSFNISSVTRSTGDYTYNFTNALADANHSVIYTTGRNDAGYNTGTGIYPSATYSTSMTSSAARIVTYVMSTGTLTNMFYNNLAVFR